MKENSHYTLAIGPSRWFLRVLGAWPDPVLPRDFFAIVLFTTGSCVMTFFTIIPQIIKLCTVLGDLNEVIEILTTSLLPTITSLSKYAIFFYQRKVLKKLNISIVEDWNLNQQHSPKDLLVMQHNATLSRKFSLVCLSLTLGIVYAQCIMKAIHGLKTRDEEVRDLYMVSYWPFNIQQSPHFEIVWLGQCIANFYGASTLSSVDAFFSVLVLHLCGQLTLLRHQIFQLVSDQVNEPDQKTYIKWLALIVERHDHLNDFASAIEDSFNMMFLAQIITTAAALVVQGYQLIMVTTNTEDGISLLGIMYLLLFVSSFSFSLFIYCYAAEKLRQESTDIVYAVYDSFWYNMHNPKNVKLLFLLMFRARIPLEITAGKFVALSLELYCSILKSTGGYLSMLLAVRDRGSEN